MSGSGRPSALPADEEIHWLVGHVVTATSSLEHQLTALIVALVGSPLVEEVVRGQRGKDSVNVARRVLRADQERDSGELPPIDRAPRPIDGALVATISAHLTEAERLIDLRDEVAHSIWIGVAEGGSPSSDPHVTLRFRRSAAIRGGWTSDQLRSLHQRIMDTVADVFIASVNVPQSRKEWPQWPLREPGQHVAVLPPWPGA